MLQKKTKNPPQNPNQHPWFFFFVYAANELPNSEKPCQWKERTEQQAFFNDLPAGRSGLRWGAELGFGSLLPLLHDKPPPAGARKLLFLFKDFFFFFFPLQNRCLHLTPRPVLRGQRTGLVTSPQARRAGRCVCEGGVSQTHRVPLKTQTHNRPFSPLSDAAPPHLLLPEGLVLRVDHPDSPFDGQQPPELVVSHHGRRPRRRSPSLPPSAAAASAPAHRRSAPAAAPRPDLTAGGGATVVATPLPRSKPRPLATSASS